MTIQVLYHDNNYIGVYKPPQIPVHRGPFNTTGPFLLQELRNLCGQRIFPVHRLDQAAAGVMFFAFSAEAASAFARLLRDRAVTKRYIIMTRGYLPEKGIIDSGLSDKNGAVKESVTNFRTMATIEFEKPTGRYPTSRYSIADVHIETGRKHQIRRHFARISHPVIGDSVYGDLRHNKTVFEISGLKRLMLFSWNCVFECPFTGSTIDVRSCPDNDIMDFFDEIGWGCQVDGLIKGLTN